MLSHSHHQPEPLTEEEEELGRLLTERYPEIARLLLQAADMAHLSYDPRKNETFLMSLSDIAAHVLVERMTTEQATTYVVAAVEDLKLELRERLIGPQTGPWARGELPRL
ncbi:MAG: hypothetical protein M3281_00650 [Chloroflexota bacterium]|nr:hypothetical protein [Chloroflexota bacterium]